MWPNLPRVQGWRNLSVSLNPREDFNIIKIVLLSFLTAWRIETAFSIYPQGFNFKIPRYSAVLYELSYFPFQANLHSRLSLSLSFTWMSKPM
jgi:hypothetical protein